MYGLSFLNSGNATKRQADWTDALDEDDYHKESQHIIAEQANVLRTHEDMQNQGSRFYEDMQNLEHNYLQISICASAVLKDIIPECLCPNKLLMGCPKS